MPVHDFKSQRLFVDEELAGGLVVACSKEQANYVRNVLRLQSGDVILVFNGWQGEWAATIAASGKRDCALEIGEKVRDQAGGPDIRYLFAPLKRGRLDYLVQKATEMGVRTIEPVITAHTVASRVNVDRLRANTIEAAEQCGVLRVPKVEEPVKLDAVLNGWTGGVPLIFADEAAALGNPIELILRLPLGGPVAVLIGPEGGFSEVERDRVLALDDGLAVSLGPRIMRADTAAVALLALVNATIGDWTG